MVSADSLDMTSVRGVGFQNEAHMRRRAAQYCMVDIRVVKVDGCAPQSTLKDAQMSHIIVVCKEHAVSSSSSAGDAHLATPRYLCGSRAHLVYHCSDLSPGGEGRLGDATPHTNMSPRA